MIITVITIYDIISIILKWNFRWNVFWAASRTFNALFRERAESKYSVLSCSCSPQVRQTFWWTRYYCSIFFFCKFLFTHPAIHSCVYGPKVWFVLKMEHISASGSNTLERTSQKDQIPIMYSVFIYLLTSANLYSWQEGLTLSVLLLFCNFLLDIHAVGCICRCMKLPPRTARGLTDGWAVPSEELKVECLNQGHLDTICWGIVSKLFFKDATSPFGGFLRFFRYPQWTWNSLLYLFHTSELIRMMVA